ncbi:hypothetical protein HPP92_020579 [Vanilla planifolia]|uniref:Uncharacterized protein n=1 Tax=Vanilla planifolia TaxID=51239 RepID=A0A835Q1J2_VANPL|nr:hypothetical protein HPP92_020579 [Vanilla planifolia]
MADVSYPRCLPRKLLGDMLCGNEGGVGGWEMEEAAVVEAVSSMKEYVEVSVLVVLGSPKMGLYGVDFGWRRLTKLQLILTEMIVAFSLAIVEFAN